jgi:hypothetical protein
MAKNMNCKQAQQRLDDYLDGQLDEDQTDSLRSHLSVCESCARRLMRENEFRSLLKQYPTESPQPGFAAQAFRNARNPAYTARSGMVKGFIAGALAASLTVWLAVGVFQQNSAKQPAASHVVLAMNKVNVVHLVFNATEDVPNAKIALQFPAYLQLAHYPGKHKLTWNSHLVKGHNMLSLPIVALAARSGEFTAKINFGDKVKTFVIKQDVQTVGHRPAASTGHAQASMGLV